MTEQFDRFKQLLTEWSQAVSVLSGQREKHPNYNIMKKEFSAKQMIRYACLCLGDNDPWSIHEVFAILYDMVPERFHPPIDPYYQGRVPVYVECWRYWALKNEVRIKYDPTSYWVEDKEGNRGEWS